MGRALLPIVFAFASCGGSTPLTHTGDGGTAGSGAAGAGVAGSGALGAAGSGASGTGVGGNSNFGTAGATPCNEAYNCAPLTTCGTVGGHVFSCLPSGTGQVDDPCSETPNTAVSCADHLTCLGVDGPQHANCTAWCNGGPSCPTGTSCSHILTTVGVSVALCLHCNAAYSCGPGETCATVTGKTFSCMAAGTSPGGATCDASVGAAVTCGERLACLAMGDPKSGTCTPWCDAQHPCAAGKACKTVVTTMGVPVPLCL